MGFPHLRIVLIAFHIENLVEGWEGYQPVSSCGKDCRKDSPNESNDDKEAHLSLGKLPEFELILFNLFVALFKSTALHLAYNFGPEYLLFFGLLNFLLVVLCSRRAEYLLSNGKIHNRGEAVEAKHCEKLYR